MIIKTISDIPVITSKLCKFRKFIFETIKINKLIIKFIFETIKIYEQENQI